MCQVRYSVAASLDGYIAGPTGEFDWIPIDPDIDFEALYAGFSGLLMGRHSYDVFVATGGAVGGPMPTYVDSRTLPEGERDGVTFVRDAATHVRQLKASSEPKPLWLWGGGLFFRPARTGWARGRCRYRGSSHRYWAAVFRPCRRSARACRYAFASTRSIRRPARSFSDNDLASSEAVA